MESIASKLRTKRESLNLSLEQISNDTRISLQHLKSLENGSYADLPGGMYNRAILRSYCDELGLNKDEILQCYSDEIDPRPEKPVISQSAPFASKIKTHTAVIWSLIVLFSIGIFLNREWFISAASLYFSSDNGNTQRGLHPEQQAAQAKNVNADASESVAAGVQSANIPAQATPADSKNSTNKEVAEVSPQKVIQEKSSAADESASLPLRLEIVGTEECWLSINRDDSGAVTKILSPGDVELFTAARTISLIVGNAGGVLLKINDRAAKTLGRSGQVVHLIIDKDTLKNFIDISTS